MNMQGFFQKAIKGLQRHPGNILLITMVIRKVKECLIYHAIVPKSITSCIVYYCYIVFDSTVPFSAVLRSSCPPAQVLTQAAPVNHYCVVTCDFEMWGKI